MSSKGWGFRKTGTAFPYLLFLVPYSLASLLLCELCAKQKMFNN